MWSIKRSCVRTFCASLAGRWSAGHGLTSIILTGSLHDYGGLLLVPTHIVRNLEPPMYPLSLGYEAQGVHRGLKVGWSGDGRGGPAARLKSDGVVRTDGRDEVDLNRGSRSRPF